MGKVVVASKRALRIPVAEIAIALFLGILALVAILPFYNVIVISLSDYGSYIKSSLTLFPPKIVLDSYRFVFLGTSFMYGIRTTVLITVFGVLYNMTLTTTLAYGLSKKWLVGRNLILNIIIFTMFFGGGLIPFYLLMSRTLGLNNNILALILPTGINTFNLIIVKNYFAAMPVEFDESPKLDGANDWQIFTKIVLPVSKPILATFGLFYAVDRWNEWWLAMLFMTDRNLYTLQLVLRDLMMFTGQMRGSLLAQHLLHTEIFDMGVRCAAIIMTTLPILFVYPFIQRHFSKGILIGAIKG
jgi:putative aldouronate transport system permease protein